ncbi:MAG: LysR family transcriptional regulator [Bdellovibrionales bacterium]
MWITIEQIQCFQAVIELGSLNAAAEKLNKAKSAVSYSIKRLEEQVGFPLFERKAYRLTPTKRALEFNTRSFELNFAVSKLTTYAKQLASGVETQLKISCTELYSMKDFSKILKLTTKQFPQTEIICEREILSGKKILKQGLADISIIENFKPDSNFEAKRIGTCQLSTYLSDSHPFFELPKSKQTEEELLKYPQIVQRSTLPDPNSAGIIEEALKWYVTGIYTKKEFILEGLGWGKLPEYLVKQSTGNKKLKRVSFAKSTDSTGIYLARKKALEHGEVAEFLWNLAL